MHADGSTSTRTISFILITCASSFSPAAGISSLNKVLRVMRTFFRCFSRTESIEIVNSVLADQGDGDGKVFRYEKYFL